MSWVSVKLGDVADVNWGDTSVTKASYVDQGHTAYSATGPDGYLPYADFDRKGVVLSAIGARCGKTWFARDKWSCIKNTIRFWSTSPRLDDRYLFWATANEDFFPKRGAAQPFITIGDARSTKISLPPIDEQRRIAAILDKADALRQMRKRAIELIQGLAVGLFDSHYSGNHNFQLHRLGSIAHPGKHTFSNGPFGSDLLSSELKSEGVPVVYIRDIRDGVYQRVSAVCVTESKAGQLQAASVAPGDVLIAKVGDPPGVAAIYPLGEPHAVVTQDVIRLRLDSAKALPHYVVALLNSSYGRHLVSSITVSATRSRFSLGDLKEMEVRLPSVSVQSEIVKKLGAIEAEAVRNAKSMLSHYSLAASLRHSALCGQL